MLGPHTTYDEGPILDVNYFPRYVLVFCISKDSLQCSRSITCTYCRRFIIFVHRVPLQYFGGDFKITAWILEEFSRWVQPWSLQASLDNFLLSAEIVRASLLECIGRCASLHIWCQCCLIFFLQNQLRIENTEHHCWHALNVLPFCIFYFTNSPNTKVNTVWVFSTAAHCCSLKK